MSTFLLALTSILLSVSAQFCLKMGMSSMAADNKRAASSLGNVALSVISNRFILAGFLLYGLGAVVWLGVLSKWEVSKAYPMVGLGFALTAILGLYLGESVSLARVGGVLMICAGVWVVSQT
jgi:multidrug transporter EmrE-like cation transporter